MSISLVTENVADSLTRRISQFFTVLITSAILLAFLSLFSDVRTVVHFGIIWFAAFAGFLTSLLMSGLIVLRRRKAKVIAANKTKAVAYSLAGLFGVVVLCAYAVFSGIPILLHHATSKDGEMYVTVAGKQYGYQRGACSPRLMIKEFTVFGSDYICPGTEALNKIQTGDRVLIKGRVSQFGIEATEIQWNSANK